jgi:ornithine decarboxylase
MAAASPCSSARDLFVQTDPRHLTPLADRETDKSPTSFSSAVSDASSYVSSSIRSPSPLIASTGGFGDHLCSQVPAVNNTRVREVMQRITQEEDAESCFYVADLRVLAYQLSQWRQLLPRIEPFYAVKCNSEPRVLQTLAQLEVSGFDCASRAEIETVLNMGISPQRIIFANPCKQLQHISYARSNGVQMMTFDNETELVKIKKLHPQAKLVLRMVTDDSHSICRFSQKFGAPMDQVEPLLLTAKRLELEVIGISFHVGSGCGDIMAFVDAVRNARKAFDLGMGMGFTMNLLDVGGGFPGVETGSITFKQIASLLAPEIDRLFPAHVRVIAEPGRYFVTSAFTLLTSIHSIRAFRQVKKLTPPSTCSTPTPDNTHATNSSASSGDMFAELSKLNVSAAPAQSVGDLAVVESSQAYMYYINDGIYGAFNCIFFDHAHAHPKVATLNRKFIAGDEAAVNSESTYETAVYGPTCDGIDCVSRNVPLPKLAVGDWLMFEDFGAYTCVAATNFNGMEKARIEFIEVDAH